jgi:beta-glucosidase
MIAYHRFLNLLSCLILSVSLAFGQAYDEGMDADKSSAFSWPEGKQMAISLTFDDARLSQIDKGIPVLDRHNLKATFYLSPDAMLQRVEGWKNAIANGHDIGNHSRVHPCTGNFLWSRERALENYTLSSMASELDSANRIIEKSLGVSPVSFAYPCGQTYVGSGLQTRSYVPLVAARFATGRTWMDEVPNDPAFCDLSQLTGIELDGKSFGEIKKLIEESRKAGSWLILAGHEMDNGGSQTSILSTIDSICQYARNPANGIWLDDVQQIGNYVRDQRGLAKHSPMLPYQDPALSTNKRIDDLICRMTLEEKIGQLNMPCGYFAELGLTDAEKRDNCKKFTEGTFYEGIGPVGGFFTLANNALFEGPAQQAAYFNELQKIAIEKTRLRIPLLQVEEGTHGLMCSGGTIFPEGPALGSTWNMELISDVYSAAAKEARAVGIHELFTLVIEPIRDPRLGRNQEAYSEDPFLVSAMARTIVQAAQGDDISQSDKVVAGLCHYPGQSQPEGGLERGAMEISVRTLREVFLPPWEAGIKEAGALGVMATYPTIDGIPAHSSKELLVDILRGDLGFEGLVLSEGNGVNTLIYAGMVETEKEAAAMATNAGMDVSISFNQGYFHEMIENVQEGKVSVATIDRSVRRVLETKFRLGLFDNPFVDPEQAVALSHTQEHQEVALQAAREGIVLLKNENQLLPLSKSIKSIAVIGPNADDEKNQLGDYTSEVILQEITTVLDGIKQKLPGAKVNYVKGCDVLGNELDEIDAAVKTAKKSEVALVVVGENEWQTPDKKGTNGEGYDMATLELTGQQRELVQRIYATGTPTIIVLINGRPLATPWISDNIPAILEAWIPGEKGGEAIADILFGDYNPSGKLSVTIPRHAGQLPVYYNYKPSKKYWLEEGWGNSYADINFKPLYEFGYGLSYSKFEYSKLQIDPPVNGPQGDFSVTVEVKNVSEVNGSEVVQLYIRDKISTVVRPVKELKGFAKIQLKSSESKMVRFEIGQKELRMLDRVLNWVVEPGDFQIMVGSSSEDIRQEGTLTVK